MKWKDQLAKASQHMQTIQIQKNEKKRIEIVKADDYTIELLGAGAHAEIYGAFLATEKDDVQINLFIVHKSPHTSAQTTLKGVAKDHSHIRFFGRIKIEPNCPDVQSFLEERVLLLSDQAKAETVPELEILSDDVKCSHAASISQIPREHLFYLQSRGVNKTESENLIVDGFLEIPEKELL